MALGTCLAAPILYFVGYVELDSYKTILAVASIIWFLFAIVWVEAAKKDLS